MDGRDTGRARAASPRWTLQVGDRSSDWDLWLRSCLEDGELWGLWLVSAAERPSLSPRNLAAVAVARQRHGYADCSDMRSEEAWSNLGAVLRRGVGREKGIPIRTPPLGGGDGEYQTVLHYPRELVMGAPRKASGVASVTYDMSDPASIELIGAALAEAHLDELGPISEWVAMRRFRIPADFTPEAPDVDHLSDATRALERSLRSAEQGMASMELALERARERKAQAASAAQGYAPRLEVGFAQRDRHRRERERRMALGEDAAQGRQATSPYLGQDGATRPSARAAARPRQAEPEEGAPSDALNILDERPHELPPVPPLKEAMAQALEAAKRPQGIK